MKKSNYHLTEDDRQNGYLRCLRAGYRLRSTFPFHPAAGKAARTARLDRLRRESSRQRVERARATESRGYGLSPHPAQAAENAEDVRWMHKEIQSLPENERDAVNSYRRGEDASVTAARLGLTPAALRALRGRGVERLRRRRG